MIPAHLAADPFCRELGREFYLVTTKGDPAVYHAKDDVVAAILRGDLEWIEDIFIINKDERSAREVSEDIAREVHLRLVNTNDWVGNDTADWLDNYLGLSVNDPAEWRRIRA